MIRSIAAVLLVGLTISTQVISFSQAREAPTFKSSTTVSSDVVRIGDLVNNAGSVADIPIFRSPDIGMTGSVSVDKVIGAIRRYHLTALNTDNISKIEVTRSGRRIDLKEIETRIAQAFSDQLGISESVVLAVHLDSGSNPINIDTSADINLANKYLDQNSGRFAVVFEVPNKLTHQSSRVRFTGKLVEMEETVVLTRSLSPGHIINASDITIERRPKAQIQRDTLSTLDEVLGLSARTSLRAGYLLRRKDIIKPRLIRRDELVTLVYETPGILLTIRGKALEAGTEGDVVNVMNIQSKRVLQGVVSGPGRINMTTATPSLLNKAVATTSQARLASSRFITE